MNEVAKRRQSFKDDLTNSYKMTRVLGIDCGSANMAFCIYDSGASTSGSGSQSEQDVPPSPIVQWRVTNIVGVGRNAKYFKITDILDFLHGLDNEGFLDASVIDEVIIEKQPAMNKKMQIVEAVLMTYFLLREDIPVKTFSPKEKLKGEKISDYRQRKKRSIEKIREYLVDKPEWSRFFESHPKKDDLSDALLMCIAYANACGAASSK